ncbi:MAG: PrsW family glutamic-type intramembrane protease [Chloroflexota bacterium]
MSLPGIILVAFTPGLFWLWFFARRHAYRPGPKSLLAFTFVLGMLSTVPAGVLNTLLLDESVLNPGASLFTVAMGMLLVVGPVEETSKLLAVWIGPRRSLYFDEPLDAFVYAAAASLGFASLENVLYVMQFGPEVMLLRAPTSTVGHVVFSGFWAFALAGRLPGGRQERIPLLAGLAASAVAHGLFNVFVFAQPLVAIGGLVFGLLYLLRRYEWAQLVSPFRHRRNVPFRRCPECRRLVRMHHSFCRYCGHPLFGEPDTLICGNCRTASRPYASFCTYCGDQLLQDPPHN